MKPEPIVKSAAFPPIVKSAPPPKSPPPERADRYKYKDLLRKPYPKSEDGTTANSNPGKYTVGTKYAGREVIEVPAPQ